MAHMTPYERVMAALTFQTPDCVPVFPVLLLQGAEEMGLSLEDYFSRGEYWAEGQLRLQKRFRHDCVFGIPHVVEDVTAFGASLIYYRNGPPSPGEMVVNSYDDVFNLSVPDPTAAPLLFESLKAIQILSDRVKGEVPIIGACIAPFSLPSMLSGTEAWMDLLLFEEPTLRQEVMVHFLDVTTQFCVRWANAQLAAGADAIVLADGIASASVITRQQFIDLALDVVIDTVKQIQGPVIHEGVGDLHPMLDLLVDTGVIGAILSCRDDPANCRALVGDRLALIGNLNNIEMRRWSVEDMANYASQILDAVAPRGGFILSAQGPEIPLGVSADAIHAMVKTAHDWRCD